MKCEDVMSEYVVSARPDDTVREARRMMQAHGVHALPVVDSNGKPLGMITTTDLLEEVEPNLQVSRLMTPHMISIPHNRDVSVAAAMMRDHEFHHLVVTKQGKVAGMLSALDLLVALELPHGSKRRPIKRRAARPSENE